MSPRSTRLHRVTLSALHFSGAGRLVASLTRGIGAIFMLHHVSPDKPRAFQPSRCLSVTPEFLEETIRLVRASGFDILSLDEAHFRLTEGEYRRPFVCFTFDDGYRDNFEHAYPVFKRHDLPFAVYVATDYVDGHGNLWWLALERAVAKAAKLNVRIDGAARGFRSGTPAEKEAAFHTIYAWLRSIEEDDARAFVREVCANIGFDPQALCREVVMGWAEIKQMAVDSRLTIGAHTRRHYALAKLTHAAARTEMEESIRRIERELGTPCRHFSFPYGDETGAGSREFALARELGLKTAVTSREGLIYRKHSGQLTHLPRIALNGDYQRQRYVKLLLSGAPFAFAKLGRGGTRAAAPVH